MREKAEYVDLIVFLEREAVVTLNRVVNCWLDRHIWRSEVT
jgi:hypothetical protein